MILRLLSKLMIMLPARVFIEAGYKEAIRFFKKRRCRYNKENTSY